MTIKAIEKIKKQGLKIDEFKEMFLYQTKLNYYVLIVKEHTYFFNSVDIAQKAFGIVKTLWFDEDHNKGVQLTESDIIDMYKEQFIIDEVCYICGKNKMCIDDMSGDLENPCFICFDCNEKRHNAENEYERREQLYDENKYDYLEDEG